VVDVLITKHNFNTMPKMDGTGPLGQGPMTGYCIGPCCGGMRMGTSGLGLGFRWKQQFRSSKNQLQVLEEEKQMLINELEAINGEIENLKKSNQ